MSKTKLLVLSVLSVALMTLTTGCGKSGKTLATVGGEKITEGDLDTLTRVNPRLKSRLSTKEGKEKVLENYVEQEVFYQESKKQGLETTQDVKDKIDLYTKIIIAQALLDHEMDKKVREYYDNHKDEYERIKISHIMVRTAPDADKTPSDKNKKATKKEVIHSEGEALKLAQQVKDRLTKREDFGTIAKEVSEDDTTKMTQGDLGYVTIHDKRFEHFGWLPLAEKAFAMKVNDVSDPIKTKDGYHIIKVTEEKTTQPLEEADMGIRFRLQADIRTDLLNQLKAKYKVEYINKTPETAPAHP